MNNQYRYHPIIENLKVNEDGTSIIYHGETLISKNYARKNNSVPMEVVSINYKSITVMRLVCECWQGMPESREFVVKRIDPIKGNHYSNLCWSKQGTGLSHHTKSNFNIEPKFTEEQYRNLLKEKTPKETLTAFLKRKEVSNKAYYTAKKRYE